MLESAPINSSRGRSSQTWTCSFLQFIIVLNLCRVSVLRRSADLPPPFLPRFLPLSLSRVSLLSFSAQLQRPFFDFFLYILIYFLSFIFAVHNFNALSSALTPPG
ncbi:uncharacterized protein APUU_70053A [Aspergillus puulaauensis]|uniref:Uncharacterized protein n=1 Tax=Aspergillus puulaauensis TaxID=1220207 RepID=A0A7R7XWZ4_9EURO|nr:uncharacterized protein APUU_70053A [Aspergillus puulaauensis]BCS28483.1 hypothetical protein APUU_70053A [Aspergillus puulaauensis]